MNDPLETVDDPGRDDAPPVPAAFTPPRHIGRYRVERALGQGAFGIVYLAHDEQLQRLVAIKVPHRNLVARRHPGWKLRSAGLLSTGVCGANHARNLHGSNDGRWQGT